MAKIRTDDIGQITDMFTSLPLMGKVVVIAGAFVGIGLVDVLNAPMRKFFNLEFGRSYYLFGAILGIVFAGSFQGFMMTDMPQYLDIFNYSIIGLGAVALGYKIYQLTK